MVKGLLILPSLILLAAACGQQSGSTSTPAASPTPATSLTPTLSPTPAPSPLVPTPGQEGLTTATVTRVVDGDTIEVTTGGQSLKLRYIGIDTPETVDPRRPVGCF